MLAGSLGNLKFHFTVTTDCIVKDKAVQDSEILVSAKVLRKQRNRDESRKKWLRQHDSHNIYTWGLLYKMLRIHS